MLYLYYNFKFKFETMKKNVLMFFCFRLKLWCDMKMCVCVSMFQQKKCFLHTHNIHKKKFYMHAFACACKVTCAIRLQVFEFREFPYLVQNAYFFECANKYGFYNINISFKLIRKIWKVFSISFRKIWKRTFYLQNVCLIFSLRIWTRNWCKISNK